jgi:hypothetical protein
MIWVGHSDGQRVAEHCDRVLNALTPAMSAAEARRAEDTASGTLAAVGSIA